MNPNDPMHEVNFASHQNLPVGYIVERDYSGAWFLFDGVTSELFKNGWFAYRAAWEHFRSCIPEGFCKCGCGGKTTQLRRKKGKYSIGEYRDFINTHNTKMLPPEEQSRRGKFPRNVTVEKTHNNQIHRKIAEEYLGAKLLPSDVVHHKDRNPQNNDPLNLYIFKSTSEHARFHRINRKLTNMELSELLSG